MNQKRRGGALRTVLPLLIYVIICNVASVAVLLYYYYQQGLMGGVQGTAEEIMDQLLAMTLENEGVLNYLTLVVGYLFAIPTFILMYRKDRLRDRFDGVEQEYEQIPTVNYLFLAVAGVFSCVAASNMIYMTGMTEASETYATAVGTLYSTGLFSELIGLGLLAPVTEELLFRGLIYRRFKEFNRTIFAIVWASIMFALLHGNRVQGIYAFVMSVFLCYCYERYQTLMAPLLVHISSNCVAVIAGETGVLDFMYGNQMTFYTVTFVCSMVLVAMVYCIERYVEPYTRVEETETHSEGTGRDLL